MYLSKYLCAQIYEYQPEEEGPAFEVKECKFEHTDLQTNTQLTKWISQFTQQLKNETVQKSLVAMNAFINQKVI